MRVHVECTIESFNIIAVDLPRDAANEVISHFGISRMGKPKYSHSNLRHVLDMLSAGHALRSGLRCSSSSSKFQGLPHSQVWEMLVDFLLVDHFTFVFFDNFLLRNAIVMNL